MTIRFITTGHQPEQWKLAIISISVTAEKVVQLIPMRRPVQGRQLKSQSHLEEPMAGKPKKPSQND